MNCIEADNIIVLENRNVKMSDDLMSKVTELQNEVKYYKDTLNATAATLDAHKQMLNDSLNSILQLKTQNIMVQKTLNESVVKCQALEKDVERLNKELEEAKKPPCEAVSSDT